MRMRLMLLGGGNALGQALIRLGAEEDIGFLAPKPPQDGWDAASLTQLLDDTRPEAMDRLVGQAHTDADLTKSACDDPNSEDGRMICRLMHDLPAMPATGLCRGSVRSADRFAPL